MRSVFTMRVRRLPVAAVLAMLAQEAGVDPAAAFDLTLPDFMRELAAARRRRDS